MINPDLRKLLPNNESRYSLVIGAAKLARSIAQNAEARGDILIEKPVSLAVDELQGGHYKLYEPAEVTDQRIL